MKKKIKNKDNRDKISIYDKSLDAPIFVGDPKDLWDWSWRPGCDD